MRDRKFWIVGSTLIFCLLLLGAILLSRRSKPTAEIEFVPVETIFRDPNALGRLFVKVRSMIPRPRAHMMMEVVATDRLGSGGFAKLIRKKPRAGAKGIAVWVLNNEELERLSEPPGLRKEEVIARARIITQEGMPGAFSSESSKVVEGTNYTAGMEVRVLAHRAGEKTDLMLGFRDTDITTGSGGAVTNPVIQTSVQFACRVQLPRQERAFIVVEQEGKTPVLISVQAWFP